VLGFKPFLFLVLLMGTLSSGVAHAQGLSCKSLFRTQIESSYLSDKPVLTPSELKQVLDFGRLGPAPSKIRAPQMKWETQVVVEGTLRLKDGRLEVDLEAEHVRDVLPNDLYLGNLTETFKKVMEQTAREVYDHLPGGAELLQSGEVPIKSSIIRYVIEPNNENLGIALHRDNARYHGTLLLDPPAAGRGGDLILEYADAPAIGFQAPYRVNQLNVFAGEHLFHGFSPYRFNWRERRWAGPQERLLMGVFIGVARPEYPGTYKHWLE
tara:strand:- start:191131 stop:191931 length:801 start_codon:yes stop_codon:yes gene_type:complete